MVQACPHGYFIKNRRCIKILRLGEKCEIGHCMNSNSLCDETDKICTCKENYVQVDNVCERVQLEESMGNFWIYFTVTTSSLLLISSAVIVYKKCAGKRSPRLQGLHPFENSMASYSTSFIQPYASSPV